MMVFGQCRIFWLGGLAVLFLGCGVFAEGYVVQGGDTLSSIALEELADGGRWREIAELNGIETPYQIAVGSELVMPVDYVPADDVVVAADETSGKFLFPAEAMKDLWPMVKGFGAMLLVIIACAVLVSSFAAGVCLKISCRLFKVKCSFMRSLMAGAGLVIAYIGWYGALVAATLLTLSFILLPVTYLLWLLGYLALSFLIIKRAVACNWLESAGLFFVSGIVGVLLGYVLVLVVGLVGGAVVERAIMMCSQP